MQGQFQEAGPIEVSYFFAFGETTDGPQGNLDALVDRTPLGFVATPEQVAPTVVHLADTDLSPYTTGQMMVVDGGATIRLGTE